MITVPVKIPKKAAIKSLLKNMLIQLFQIKGMICGACAYAIQKHFLRLKGVKEAIVHYNKQELKIRYDERSIHEKKLTESIVPFGYSIEKIKTG